MNVTNDLFLLTRRTVHIENPCPTRTSTKLQPTLATLQPSRQFLWRWKTFSCLISPYAFEQNNVRYMRKRTEFYYTRLGGFRLLQTASLSTLINTGCFQKYRVWVWSKTVLSIPVNTDLSINLAFIVVHLFNTLHKIMIVYVYKQLTRLEEKIYRKLYTSNFSIHITYYRVQLLEQTDTDVCLHWQLFFLPVLFSCCQHPNLYKIPTYQKKLIKECSLCSFLALMSEIDMSG